MQEEDKKLLPGRRSPLVFCNHQGSNETTPLGMGYTTHPGPLKGAFTTNVHTETLLQIWPLGTRKKGRKRRPLSSPTLGHNPDPHSSAALPYLEKAPRTRKQGHRESGLAGLALSPRFLPISSAPPVPAGPLHTYPKLARACSLESLFSEGSRVTHGSQDRNERALLWLVFVGVAVLGPQP